MNIFSYCEKRLLCGNDRRQYVVYDKEKSDFANIKTGVPQRSILGPYFLYILMIFQLRVDYLNFLCMQMKQRYVVV